jgi:hypothetical protein
VWRAIWKKLANPRLRNRSTTNLSNYTVGLRDLKRPKTR